MSISQNLTIELIKLQKINFGWHKVEFLKKVSQKISLCMPHFGEKV